MKSVNVIAILLLIVGAGAGFFGGMKYQQNQSSNQIQNSRRNFVRSSGQGQFGRAVVGQIISQDDKSITVKLSDGSSKIIFLPDSVIISKTDSGSKGDLKDGLNVAIFGTNNSDGSVTAQNVQLNPMFRTRGG